MDMAGWGPEELRGPGASGRARAPGWPRLCPQEQQHCATSPGSPAPHAVQRTRAGGRRGVRKEREGGAGRALADAHTHTEQTEACGGWHCLTCSRYCRRLAAAHGGLASPPLRARGKRDRKGMRAIGARKGLPGHGQLRGLCLLVPGRGRAGRDCSANSWVTPFFL